MASPPSYNDTINDRLLEYTSDDEYVNDINGFHIKSKRLSFIRKVYSILSFQLLFTTLACVLCMKNSTIKDYLHGENGEVLIFISILLSVVTLIILFCCNFHRKYPQNIVCLSIFTMCMSISLGSITSYYDTYSVILAGGACALITLTLTIYSVLTKKDFTVFGGTLLCFIVILLFMGIMSVFIKNDVYQLVYSGLGALVFSVYIIYDTQLIVGGRNRKFQLEPEDYVLGALSLYLDIINLFIYLLNIIGKR